jgi:adenylate kinase
MSPTVIFFLGRPGSGKGTQITRFAKNNEFAVVETGKILRERAREKDFLGKKIKETLSQGGLIPTPVVFLLWMPILLHFQEKGTKGIIFDGNPRKLYEAYMLEEVFSMFGWKDFFAINLKISEKEALKRLAKRKKEDDEEEKAHERLRWLRKEVMPVVSYFQEKELLIEVNGEQSTEDVEKEIERKIERFKKKINDTKKRRRY